MAYQYMMETAIYKHKRANDRSMQMARMMTKLNKAVLKIKEKYRSHGLVYDIIDCELIRIADEFELLICRRSYALSAAADVASNNHPDTASRVRAAMNAAQAMIEFADGISDVYDRTCRRVNKMRNACEKHCNDHLDREAVTTTEHKLTIELY